MKGLRAILLLGLLPPVGIVIPAYFRLQHQPAIVIVWFGVFLAVTWLFAIAALRKKSRWSRQVARIVVATYLAIGMVGFMRYDFIRYEFNSVALLLGVLGSWLAIWIIAPLTLWSLIGGLGRAD